MDTNDPTKPSTILEPHNPWIFVSGLHPKSQAQYVFWTSIREKFGRVMGLSKVDDWEASSDMLLFEKLAIAKSRPNT